MEGRNVGDVWFHAMPEAPAREFEEETGQMDGWGRGDAGREVPKALQLYACSAGRRLRRALWQSNGPVYNNGAIKLTFFSSLSVHALCYLLIRLARPGFVMPEGSDILFELDWMQDHASLVGAYTELYGKAPKPPLRG